MNEKLIEFGDWVGTSLKELKFEGDLIGQGHHHFEIKFNASRDFCGMLYNHVSIFCSEHDIISLVSISFREIVNRSSFDGMIEKYGEPNAIVVEDILMKESKSENIGDFNQSLAKREYSMKSVKFGENPTWIFWQKKDFQINIHLQYEYKTTRIMFKKPK